MTPSNSCCHVKSAENPADCASHGLLPSELKNLLFGFLDLIGYLYLALSGLSLI